METLGEKLKKSREKAGYTLKEVEEKIGVSNSYLSELERNIKTNPSNELLKKLADLYSVDFLKFALTKTLSNMKSGNYGFMYETILNLISKEELNNLNDKERRIARVLSSKIKNYKPSVNEAKMLLFSGYDDFHQPYFSEKDTSDEEIQRIIDILYSNYGEITKVPVVNNIESNNFTIKSKYIIEYEKVPTELVKNGEYFYYKINDESMINAGILKDDIVLVRKQDKVQHKNIFLIVDESNNTTLKRVFIDNETFIFQSENPSYDPIVDTNNKIKIIGKVISLKRRFE